MEETYKVLAVGKRTSTCGPGNPLSSLCLAWSLLVVDQFVEANTTSLPFVLLVEK
jgi:hypothetical protein